VPALARNAPCPCESGRRYKDCCGTLASSVPGERVRALIGAALASYGRDELRDAERLCREALAIDSGALDALHMMGAICYRTGRLWQSYGFVREELERTGWRIRAMRDEFARLHDDSPARMPLRSGGRTQRAVERQSRGA